MPAYHDFYKIMSTSHDFMLSLFWIKVHIVCNKVVAYKLTIIGHVHYFTFEIIIKTTKLKKSLSLS